MSAGGLTYHGVVGYGKATLPSVESWGSNMNILRDPPRSIQTFRKDKVGSTSEITQMIDEAGDRIGEMIKPYARGTNPFVAVSYSNNANNAGQRVNNSRTGGGTNSEAFLPYRIMRHGAFRFPVKTQRELLPLSRLPRTATSMLSNPMMVDFSKKAMCPTTDERTKQVKSQVLRTCVRPTAIFNISTPISEPYDTRNHVKDLMNVSAESGLQPMSKPITNSEFYSQAVNENVLHPELNVNMGNSSMRKDAEISHFSTENYIQEPFSLDVRTKPSQANVTSIADLFGDLDQGMNVKNTLSVSRETAKSSALKNYDHYSSRDMELNRNVPVHSARTNKAQNIQMNNSTRSVYLRPKVNPGGFDGAPSIPSIQRQQLLDHDPERTEFNQRVYGIQSQRTDAFMRNPYIH